MYVANDATTPFWSFPRTLTTARTDCWGTADLRNDANVRRTECIADAAGDKGGEMAGGGSSEIRRESPVLPDNCGRLTVAGGAGGKLGPEYGGFSRSSRLLNSDFLAAPVSWGSVDARPP
jgi:hypothetical protein